MAGLRRSGDTFRRSGSSGLVWEDRFLTDEMNQQSATKKKKNEEGVEFREMRQSRSVGSAHVLERSRSNGDGGGGGGYRTAGRVSPTLDPPSPKVSACGFCGIFGKPQPSAGKSKHKAARR